LLSKSTSYAGGTNSCFLKPSLRWSYKWLLSKSTPYARGTIRVARLALSEPKTVNLALLRSSWLQNLYLAIWLLFGSCNFFVPQICLGEELRVVRVACPRYHKTRGRPPYSCVMLNEHPNIPKKR